ncbi:YciI family protein [Kribbella sp. NPDC051587]|uniref:YciI family protein n=1 Tax=Kribbella sp. NPDC051587 TaxID=3364119 RepID=UPI0037A830B6
MAKYLISFDRGAMDHIPAEDFPQVGEDAHAVCREAKEAGVLIFTGGIHYSTEDELLAANPAVVDTDGLITDGPYPESKELIGGVFVVDVPTRDEALQWAAKVAKACRCAQDVRMFMHDPEL